MARLLGPDPAPVLRHLRAMMPGVAGVVLADPQGRPLASDLPADPAPVAARALRERASDAPCAGTLVRWEGRLCLVVFLPKGTVL